jgi:uncharacterized protein (TIGR03000 family)
MLRLRLFLGGLCLVAASSASAGWNGITGYPSWYRHYGYEPGVVRCGGGGCRKCGGAGQGTLGVINPRQFTQAPTAPATTATVEIKVPDASAKIALNGTPMTQSGKERVYQSPELAPGQLYHYTVTASFLRNGQEVTEQRRVEVSAGASIAVDFSTTATAER